jgi:hypothetical protein
MRAALESEHTGLHLHSWIDCIWGVSRKNVKLKNIFTDICYTDSKIIKGHFEVKSSRLYKTTEDIENYFKKDCHLSSGTRMKYQALDLQISQFGRVPKCIFSFAHPKKKIKSMKNKKNDDILLDQNLNLLGISPLEFQPSQSFSDINGNTEIQSTSRFEDFDLASKSKN